MKKHSVFFEAIEINLITSQGSFPYFEDGQFKELDPVEAFGLEELYWGTHLDGVEGPFTAFNTYNWGAPVVIAGARSECGAAVVNIHRGGDVRGNYSGPYLVEDSEDIFTQTLELYIRLSNGREFRATTSDFCACDFFFETFDVYMNSADFEELPLTLEMIDELAERCEEITAEVAK